MDERYFVHIFTPTKNVSPFDVNMAHSAKIEGVVPYTEVALDDIHYLTQDLIYSQGSQRTGIFIGGRDYGLAIDMFYRARPPWPHHLRYQYLLIQVVQLQRQRQWLPA